LQSNDLEFARGSNLQYRYFMITFKGFETAQKGQIADLLEEIYKTFYFKGNEFEDNKQYWKQLDARIFENLTRENDNGFVTYFNNELIGMCYWAKLNSENEIKLKDNGITEKFTGRGYGKMQIIEMIRRLQKKNCAKIYVTTGDNDFYKPAQNMYLSCGFIEIKREEKYGNKLIHYEKTLI